MGSADANDSTGLIDETTEPAKLAANLTTTDNSIGGLIASLTSASTVQISCNLAAAADMSGVVGRRVADR